MPGKPFQSQLKTYEQEVFAWLNDGRSYRWIAAEMNRLHGVTVTHNAVFSFVKSRRLRPEGVRLFYEGLAPDIRDQLIKQIAAVWTHDSTAIEGNTLTFGETVKVLELGLTISGKPLRDHQEVYGHARAIDLMYRMIRAPALTEDDLFALHEAVMEKSAMDIMNPVGHWKQDFNGTTGVMHGKSVYMEYASPLDVPALMKRWLQEFNRRLGKAVNPGKAVECYANAHMGFVRIHPFFDGNGRVARLVSNLPVLRGGFPPLVIPRERRGDYVDLLWEYQNTIGKIQRRSVLVPAHETLERFESLLDSEWRHTTDLVESARRRQQERVGGGGVFPG